MSGRPEMPKDFEVSEPTTLGAAQNVHAEKAARAAALANVKGGYKMRGGGDSAETKALPPLLASKEKVGGPMQMQARMIEQASADGGPIPEAKETIGGGRKRRRTRRKSRRKKRKTRRKRRKTRRKRRKTKRKRKSRRKRGGMCGCEKNK